MGFFKSCPWTSVMAPPMVLRISRVPLLPPYEPPFPKSQQYTANGFIRLMGKLRMEVLLWFPAVNGETRQHTVGWWSLQKKKLAHRQRQHSSLECSALFLPSRIPHQNLII